MLYEEAARVSLLGFEVYAYGLYVALGVCAAVLLLWLLGRQARLPKGAAALTGALAIPLALIVSRLLFCLTDAGVRDMLSLKAILAFSGGGYSMFGALLGAALGACLAAKIIKVKPLKLLDLLAPALMLFIAFERLGEGVLELPFGVSRPLTSELMKTSVLAVEGDYESYLSTYLLESFAAFVLAVTLQICRKNYERDGSALLLAMILFGASQTIFESLRFDAHMRISFVGVQQVLSIATMMVPVLCLAVKLRKESGKCSLAAFITLPLALILGIAIEFMIDRSGFNKFILYAAFTLVVFAPAYIGIRLLDRRDSLGQEAG